MILEEFEERLKIELDEKVNSLNIRLINDSKLTENQMISMIDYIKMVKVSSFGEGAKWAKELLDVEKREIIEGFAEWYMKPGKYMARDVMNDLIDRYLKETSKTIEQ